MATWSGIRKKLETEYLAQSLRGHIQYSFRGCNRFGHFKYTVALYQKKQEKGRIRWQIGGFIMQIRK